MSQGIVRRTNNKRSNVSAWVTWIGAIIAVIAIVISANATGEVRELWIHNNHTKETKRVTFKNDGEYVQSGLIQLNHLLRDFRENKVIEMDPELFDLLWEVYQKSGSQKPIHVVSGYRTHKTNKLLKRRGHSVARNSQHLEGKAIDVSLPDVSAKKLRELGLKAHKGGVGYYSGSFVHLDTGRVRHWPIMSRKQLAKVFPEGRTIHVPSDGKKMHGHQVAVANLSQGLNYDGTPRVAQAEAIFAGLLNQSGGEIPVPSPRYTGEEAPVVEVASVNVSVEAEAAGGVEDPFVRETQVVAIAPETLTFDELARPRTRPQEQQQQGLELVVDTEATNEDVGEQAFGGIQVASLATPKGRVEQEPSYQVALVGTPTPSAAEQALEQQIGADVEVRVEVEAEQSEEYTLVKLGNAGEANLKLGDLEGERVRNWTFAKSTRRGPLATLTAPNYNRNTVRGQEGVVAANGFTKNLPTMKTGLFVNQNPVRIAFANFQKEG